MTLKGLIRMARPSEMREYLKNGNFNERFSQVYPGAADENIERFCGVLTNFEKLYENNDRALELFSAPGRTEVCGNHTDHNHGCVLAAAISLDAIAAAAKTDNSVVRIKTEGYHMDEVDCSDLSVHEDEKGRSAALVRGTVARFKQLGYNVGGFDAATASSVLPGSGMSSSAAFEVLVGTILSYLYNDGKVSPVEIAKIAQYAENEYFGKPCGLMDQMACSVGSFVNIDFRDPASPIIKKVDFDFDSCGHSLCIVDTKGSHSDLTDEYAAVRKEMEASASVFGKNVLRELDEDEFVSQIAQVRRKAGDRAVLRALHFYADNKRVDEEVAALESNDFDKFKSLVIESGHSSYMYNQNVYSCKQPCEQPVSVALAISERILAGSGAWRVHGGGFAGTIQAFVPNDILDTYTSAMKAVFGDDSCHILKIRQFGGIKLI